MLKEINEGKFIEHNEYAGNLYGTSKKAVADVAAAGKICIFDVDLNGILSLKKTDLHPLFVMIVPPSREELERRLRGRGDTAEDAIQKRLKQAEWELSFKDRPDFWDVIITNDDLDRAYAQFKTFCLQDSANK
jgi:guanylate kinase